jgi:peptidoglycan/LPS O-acetylase OafA/YrhL
MNNATVAPVSIPLVANKISNRFSILDPLRFLAAVAVLFYHYSVYFKIEDSLLLGSAKFGYLGVMFFFMLSGFVISSSATNSTPLKFAFARAKRLYPAFIACLAITLLVVYLCKGQYWPWKNIFLNGLIINDYFGVPDIDGVYWTLQAEIKFYGCVFILIALGQFKRNKLWLPVWLTAACLHYFTKQPFFMGWFISPAYSFFFIGGVCAFLMHKNRNDSVTKFYFMISLIFGVVTAGEQVKQFISMASLFDVWMVRIIVFAFYVFFYALSQGKCNFQRVPGWWLYLGAISYPLYLLHNLCGKTLIDSFQGVLPLPLLVPLISLVVVLMALAVHILIEKPISKLKFTKA